MKKRVIVTFFDSNYIAKAIATYKSLAKVHDNFELYAFCYDDLSYQVVKKLNYENFIPIQPSEFENEELLRVKAGKTKMYEYYWACKPYTVSWIMNKTGAESVTYIDCDFMFFQSPEPIFEESDRTDVLIQPNNFSYDEEKQFLPVGYYCSCWETFRNNTNGRAVLEWWHKSCMEWCYARFEEGKFADQKYLDKWRLDFKGVREVVNIGANIAPWNVQKYDLSNENGKVLINNLYPVIYYHYHSFKMNLIDYSYILTGDRENFYRLQDELTEVIYRPYIELLKECTIEARKIQEYDQYAHEFPDSNIKLANNQGIATFDSYKEAAANDSNG